MDRAPAQPYNGFERYHAHVYFDASTLQQAQVLCATANARFGIAQGRVHQRPVGPHPCWSCQLSFDSEQFETVIGWLEQHRDGLTVLVHPRTGDDLADHSTHAAWLGRPVALKLSIFES